MDEFEKVLATFTNKLDMRLGRASGRSTNPVAIDSVATRSSASYLSQAQ